MVDIKRLIIDNEKLKSLVLDLEEKIDTHNKSVISSDSTIRQQIEVLTRHTLSKKTIDWMSQKDVLVKSAGEMEAINTKLRRFEMKEYNSSSLLNSVAVDMDNFVNEGRNVSVTTTRTITTGNVVDNGVQVIGTTRVNSESSVVNNSYNNEVVMGGQASTSTVTRTSSTNGGITILEGVSSSTVTQTSTTSTSSIGGNTVYYETTNNSAQFRK